MKSRRRTFDWQHQKDFPIKAVELMLKKQVEQGNKEDISVFQKKSVMPPLLKVVLTGLELLKALLSGARLLICTNLV